MLDKIRVLNDRGIDRTFILNELYSGVTVRDISGLGPVKAELNNTQLVNGVGMHYNSRSIGSRNIVFSVGMAEVGSKTVEDIRYELYDCFPTGEEVEFHFESSSGRTNQIFGRVESVSPDIFSREPALQVSIVCVDPYFREYPGDNHIVVLSTEDVPVTIPYLGRVTTGATIEFKVTSVPPPTIFGKLTIVQTIAGLPDRTFNIYDFDIAGVTGGIIGRFTMNDVIKVTTVPGKKSATFTRNGVEYNIIGALKDNFGHFLTLDQWPLLVAGKATTFKYQASVYNSSHLQVKVSWDVLVEGL